MTDLKFKGTQMAMLNDETVTSVVVSGGERGSDATVYFMSDDTAILGLVMSNAVAHTLKMGLPDLA
jgi:hypothetical protein